MMTSLQWEPKFLTELKIIDEQHRNLVDAINQLGTYLTFDDLVKKDTDKLVYNVLDYSNYHFEQEEELMLKFKVDIRHFEKHTKTHTEFIKNVNYLYDGLDISNKNQCKIYFKYLVLYVRHHIFGIDREMANQIKNIQSGMTPEQAYHHESQGKSDISEPLIEVLYELFAYVDAQNKALKELNESLEEKVALRTHELSESNTHLEQLALTDPLTGLPNRRHAMYCLPKLWDESIQTQQKLFCFMIDVDHFKKINDDFGHNTGDLVLTELTETISEHLRNDDIFCRLGGDEFILMCPNTSKAGAKKVTNLILREVRKLKVKNHIEEWQCSISIGGASRLQEMHNYEDIIKAADNALYVAKAAGKDCVRFSE